MSYAKIGNALLMTEGVEDYTVLSVNAGTVNVAITNTEIPTIGVITLTEV